MANGASLGLLSQAREIFAEATPQNKIQPAGFLAMLVDAMSPTNVKYDSFDGHYKTVKVKLKKRLTKYHTDTSANCTDTNVNAYVEDTVSVANFRQIAVAINLDTIRTYDSYASKLQADPNFKIANMPKADIAIMQELWNDVMLACNGLLDAVDDDLTILAAANVGKNITTGSVATTAINISKDVHVQELNGGVNRIMGDFKKNFMSGRIITVGDGLFYNYMLNQKQKSNDAFGVDTKIQAGQFDFYYDPNMATNFGTNQIVCYEKDAIQLVPYLKNRGSFAGRRANSTFFTMQIPLMTLDGAGNMKVIPFTVDAQLKEYDCSEDVNNAYGGGTTTLSGGGFNLILSLNFGLYTIPSTAYLAFDQLTGNRGSLRFTVANDCDTCS